MSDIFLKPEKPFLLMFEDVLGRERNEWFSTEEEFEERVREVVNKPCSYINVQAIEIGSCRDIDINVFVKQNSVSKEWGNFKKGDRVKGVIGGRGVIDSDPVGIGYIVKWDSGKIEKVQSGTIKYESD